jgi:hypothetical protein
MVSRKQIIIRRRDEQMSSSGKSRLATNYTQFPPREPESCTDSPLGTSFSPAIEQERGGKQRRRNDVMGSRRRGSQVAYLQANAEVIWLEALHIRASQEEREIGAMTGQELQRLEHDTYARFSAPKWTGARTANAIPTNEPPARTKFRPSA